MKNRYLLFLALGTALLTFTVFVPALRNDFVNWDDDIYVYDNRIIRSLGPVFFREAFFGFHEANWIPLTWLSHAIDYALWGLNPLGHHLTSIVFHSVNSFLVVWLVYALLDADGFRKDERSGESARLIVCGATGILFGIHPLRVESVVWISERKDVLYGFFGLLSIIAYMRYVGGLNRDVGGTMRKTYRPDKRYLLSLLFFACALLSKPMAVTLPLILLLLDWACLRRLQPGGGRWFLIAEKIPFFALSLFVSVIGVAAQRAAGAMPSLGALTLQTRVMVAFNSLILYLWKVVAPYGLLPFYPHPKVASFFSWPFFLTTILTIGITAICLTAVRRRRVWLALWGYYVIALFPGLGLFQTGSHAMADRFTYLPSLGPSLLFGLATARVFEKVATPGHHRIMTRRLATALAIVLSVGLAYRTIMQVSIWENSMELWNYEIENEPARFPLAYINRGLVLQSRGLHEQALADFSRAITLDNGSISYLALVNRGIVYRVMGQGDRALDDFNAAIVSNPAYSDAYTTRGMLLMEFGRSEEAIVDFNKAISLDPKDVGAYMNRGIAFKERGLFDRATADYDKVLELQPDNTDAYNNRGVVHRHLNQFGAAVADYTRAIELNPSFFLAYCNRGVVYGLMGQGEKAIEDYTAALTLKPDLVRAYLERADLYRLSGNLLLAVADYHKACDFGSEAGCEAMKGHVNR